MINHVGAGSFMLGADPELFLARDGKVIGAERVIPQSGIPFTSLHLNPKSGVSEYGKIVLDGVQAEINYNPIHVYHCRQTFASYTTSAMIALKEFLRSQKIYEGISLYTLGSVVDIDQEELNQLSPAARQLGCQPSFNHYDKDAKIEIDILTYRTRSAGGHIHFGLGGYPLEFRAIEKDLIPICDAILGLISVMVDRDPRMADRRQVYGKAGEYRTPKYGIEYRTLSNFWLRSYPLLSMVFALAKQAVGILYYSRTAVKEQRWDSEAKLFSLVDLQKVRTAIDTNDLQMAKDQWEGLKKFFHDHSSSEVGLNKDNLPWFEHFLSRIEKDGLHTLFPNNPLDYWPRLKTSLGQGFETYLAYEMRMDIQAKGAEHVTSVSI